MQTPINASLEDQLAALTAESAVLKARIAELEAAAVSAALASPVQQKTYEQPPPRPPPATSLTPDEYKRYGRQMILHEIGLPGQLTLKNARVLLVGLGGLGCPASLYLSAAGIGTLSLLDHDTVELSNLHRQILHTPSTIGVSKVLSAAAALQAQNPNTTVHPYAFALTPQTALPLISAYDLVLDCTDAPALRYLISDACVLSNKPLVSASALRWDAQISVLNYPPGSGACYRCMWPVPPPPVGVATCGDAGVLGGVVGAIGVMMAVEAVKVLLDRGPKECRLTMLSAGTGETVWRGVRMRGKRKGCVTCGDVEDETMRITKERLMDGRMDYVEFCGGRAAAPTPIEQRVTVTEARRAVRSGKACVVDIRDATQFGICSLPGSINIPFDEFLQTQPNGALPAQMEEVLHNEKKLVYFLCRLGNDSQISTNMVVQNPEFKDKDIEVKDIVGGIMEWARVAPGDGVFEY